MLVFHCEHCGSLLFFENVRCLGCEHRLGFLPDILELSALEPAGEGAWLALNGAAKRRLYRACQNSAQYEVCNWLVPIDDPSPLCASCRLNHVIPDLGVSGNVSLWHKLEMAKRRLLYTIRRLSLPMDSGYQHSQLPLNFSFVADTPGAPPAATGHENGLITVNLAEADDAERERRRVDLREPHRTLLGHFRHESGHYYWERLVAETHNLIGFRRLFGDERQGYSLALLNHYAEGAPTDWQDRFVSAYSSSHPWEDWAESWAHYFHMIDAMETAASFGMTLVQKGKEIRLPASLARPTARKATDFDEILARWLPLTYALNSINRGMGLPDLYPFVLSEPVIRKLRFIHDLIDRSGA